MPETECEGECWHGRLRDGRCSLLLQFEELTPDKQAEAREWAAQYGMSKDRAARWVIPLKWPKHLFCPGVEAARQDVRRNFPSSA